MDDHPNPASLGDEASGPACRGVREDRLDSLRAAVRRGLEDIGAGRVDNVEGALDSIESMLDELEAAKRSGA